jgi:alpha/beta superfamily hydrolase
MKTLLSLSKTLAFIFPTFITLSVLNSALINPAAAQPSSQSSATPEHAVGLKEKLVSVELSPGIQQQGVLSLTSSSTAPTRLAVLFPGYPSVVRPVVEWQSMTSSKLSGNFLIRSRRHLATDTIATLIVDCHSDSGDYCSSTYQASSKRHQDVLKLIQEVKKQYPSIQEVWAIGTSMGTVSSSFALTHEPSIYKGAIHTASITEPNARNSYRELSNFDYAKANHIFIHHLNDPCYLTTHSGAKSIADKYRVPLVTVKGGGGFSGDACKAFTEHGFRGKEKEVMTAIGKIMMTAKVESLLID